VPATRPYAPSSVRIAAVALTPLALVGGGAGLALVGFGLSAASGVGIGAALAGLLAWLDLRGGP